MESVTLLVGRDEDSLKEVDQVGKYNNSMYNVYCISSVMSFDLSVSINIPLSVS